MTAKGVSGFGLQNGMSRRFLCKLRIKITTGGYPQITQITQINDDDVKMIYLAPRASNTRRKKSVKICARSLSRVRRDGSSHRFTQDCRSSAMKIIIITNSS